MYEINTSFEGDQRQDTLIINVRFLELIDAIYIDKIDIVTGYEKRWFRSAPTYTTIAIGAYFSMTYNGLKFKIGRNVSLRPFSPPVSEIDLEKIERLYNEILNRVTQVRQEISLLWKIKSVDE